MSCTRRTRIVIRAGPSRILRVRLIKQAGLSVTRKVTLIEAILKISIVIKTIKIHLLGLY